MKQSNIALSGGAIDTLYKLCVHGACDDGDLPSKQGLSELISHGFALKNYDLMMANHPTRLGTMFFNDYWYFNPIVIKRYPQGAFSIILGMIPNNPGGAPNPILSDDNIQRMLKLPKHVERSGVKIATITKVTIETDGSHTAIHGRITPVNVADTLELFNHKSEYKVIPFWDGTLHFTHFEMFECNPRFDKDGLDFWKEQIDHAKVLLINV